MSEADQFASQLPKLISKSKVAKTLEEARLLIINKDDDLFRRVLVLYLVSIKIQSISLDVTFI